jgi:hypothetical protein
MQKGIVLNRRRFGHVDAVVVVVVDVVGWVGGKGDVWGQTRG